MHPENYTEIQQVLAEERSLTDAAEAHGTLAGCLCAAIGYRFETGCRKFSPKGGRIRWPGKPCVSCM